MGNGFLLATGKVFDGDGGCSLFIWADDEDEAGADPVGEFELFGQFGRFGVAVDRQAGATQFCGKPNAGTLQSSIKNGYQGWGRR